MIERYIYAVTKELPENYRDEVALDLKALIYEMIDDCDDQLSEEQKIESVLRKLGHPKKLAAKYRGKERYLIGPGYFDRYLFFIKIVLLSILIGISVSVGMRALTSNEGVIEVIVDYLFTLFSASLQGLAWVTLIFALLEYYDVSLGAESAADEWDPASLPLPPERKADISRGESIFSIIFSTVFLILFVLLSDRIGIYYDIGSDYTFIPLFNTEVLDNYLVLIVLVFIINILIEVIKVIKGKWTIRLAVVTALLNIISAAVFITIINTMSIWNNEIIMEYEQFVPFSFDRLILSLTLLVIVVTIAESGTALYKAYRYG